MTREAAIHSFFNSFTVPAYEENSVPENAAYPYITYSTPLVSFGDKSASSCNIWTRSSSWAKCIEVTGKIAEKIGFGGCCISCDNGGLWIKRATPFVQNMGDTSDKLIKRRYIQLEIEMIGE